MPNKLGRILILIVLFIPAYVSGDDGRVLTVTATAYNSLPGQTQGDPKITAWGDVLVPGMKAIAVSRDLIAIGLTHGVKVRIDGLKGTFVVLDKLHKRWRRRIDIYMGNDVNSAKQWGKRKVTIRW
jgi:3D (Asp-Asp-Asp) domain-containing protein